MLDILVENAGHVNYGYLESRKGGWGRREGHSIQMSICHVMLYIVTFKAF